MESSPSAQITPDHSMKPTRMYLSPSGVVETADHSPHNIKFEAIQPKEAIFVEARGLQPI